MHKETKRILFQIALFVITFISTTLAGTEWVYSKSVYVYTPKGGIGFNTAYSWNDFVQGMAFSVPLLLILTVHEFGHYFTAMYHKVKTSLPYYIPIPPIPFLIFTLGTMGAVIRLRSRPRSNVQNFDIGLAGPLAGFLVAVAFLFYGFKTLPSPDYVFQFHPEYKKYGISYADHVYSAEYMKDKGLIDTEFGSNLLFWIFSSTVATPDRVPNPHELMHYPVLMACYFALLFTCLNLLPIGQLDGGHVVYGLFGFRAHKIIATIFFIALMFYSGLGLSFIKPDLPKWELLMGVAGYLLFLFTAFSGLRLPVRETVMYTLLVFAIQFSMMEFIPGVEGYQGWLLFGFLIGRFVGVEHPPCEIEQPLDSNRVILGWLALLIFILCFSPAPLSIG
jgi:membrane-associated protease RseP (regulator of RpoE activity)